MKKFIKSIVFYFISNENFKKALLNFFSFIFFENFYFRNYNFFMKFFVENNFI